MSTSPGRLVFTDLDGSLLDHHSYSFEAAIPLLAQLQSAQIPVVPTTSKTRVEIEALRQQLGNTHPFIVENGAAILIPEGYFPRAPEGTVSQNGYWLKELSPPRRRWLEVLEKLAPIFSGEFDYFYRAGPAGIAEMTGLSLADAELAHQREYSEPVKWLGSEERKEEFVQAAMAAGANPLQGGRFLTLAGECDKGRALAWLREAYRRAWGTERVSDIAIGDSGNDVAMLEAAETALLVRSPVHGYPRLQRTVGVIYSTRYGPEGWVEGVGQWLAIEDPQQQTRGQ